MKNNNKDYFGETQTLVRQNVGRFIEREVRPFIDEWEEQGSFPREIYEKAGAAGILGIGHPEEFGGTDVDIFSKIAASEALMRSTSGGFVASLGSLDIGLPPVWKWGGAI